MANDNLRLFKVDDGSSYDGYKTLEDATLEARSKAWRYGEDYYIFKAIAVANAPEAVNNVVVKDL